MKGFLINQQTEVLWENWGWGGVDIVSMLFLLISFFMLLLSTYLCLCISNASSCREYITGSHFYIQSDNLWFLTEVFTSFIFNVIIDMAVFKSIIMLYVFYLSLLFFIPLLLIAYLS